MFDVAIDGQNSPFIVGSVSGLIGLQPTDDQNDISFIGDLFQSFESDPTLDQEFGVSFAIESTPTSTAQFESSGGLYVSFPLFSSDFFF